MAPRLNPILATAATLVALAACSQNPQFRMNMASQAYGALNELYVLLARADLGTLRAPASFADQAESYAVIIGGFEVAGLLAAGRPPGREASEDLAATIGRCVTGSGGCPTSTGRPASLRARRSPAPCGPAATRRRGRSPPTRCRHGFSARSPATCSSTRITTRLAEGRLTSRNPAAAKTLRAPTLTPPGDLLPRRGQHRIALERPRPARPREVDRGARERSAHPLRRKPARTKKQVTAQTPGSALFSRRPAQGTR